MWEPVSDYLKKRGRHTIICAGPERLSAGRDVQRAFLDALPDNQDLVLVPHSNAGAYIPGLTTSRRVVAAVFVDAVLPPRNGEIALAPTAFLDFLSSKTDDNGFLPPWTRWWDDADIAALFPSAEVRAVVEREQQPIPLSYFEGSLPVVPTWDNRPCGYLAFGDTYAVERDDAARRGWPVSTLPGRHLHMLMDPEQVGTELLTLMGLLGL